MLVVSEGDIYQIANINKPELKRLTKTEASERRVNYLADGSGYTYQSGDVVFRKFFDGNFVEQINPKLPGGQSLRGYRLSPDGNQLVLTGVTGSRMQSDHQVDVIRYRDRFAKSSKVSRTVSDDAMKPQDIAVYIYRLDDTKTESSKLYKIFESKLDEPRDVISTPDWSLDSSKVTFCFFDQKNSEVHIMLGGLPKEKKDEATKKGDAKKKGKKKGDAKAKTKKTDSEKKDEKEKHHDKSEPGDDAKGKDKKDSDIVDLPARIVYRFKHDGGPNTPGMVSPNFAWDARHILFVSEQTGFRHVHLLDALYESVRVLTTGNFEVYPFGISKDQTTMFVRATKESPSQEIVYSLDLKSGDLERISKKDGTYSSAAVSDDGTRMLSNFVTYGQLPELVSQDKKKEKTLTDSHPPKAVELTKTKPEFFDYENRHGHKISGMMFKPKGWKKSQKA